MILCIDIGNSLVHLGLFDKDQLKLQFRYNSRESMSSDQFGIFIKSVLQENAINCSEIKHATICSVVPELDYSIRAAVIKYLKIDPFFLNIGAETGLKIKRSNPSEIGADLIATAIGAVDIYPKTDLMVVDMGTATTVCAVTKEHEFLGGAILTGLKTSARALQTSTAKLGAVEIVKPAAGLGKNTKENIQIGLFYGHLGAVREITDYLAKQTFAKMPYKIIGTGGFSELYKNEDLFDKVVPELALRGLNKLHYMNLGK